MKAEAPKVEEPVKQESPKEAGKSSEEGIEAPKDRKELEAIVEKYGAEAAIDVLSKVRVVDLRTLAREFNGEFGIAGREITLANKKALIEEFRTFFSK